MTRWTIERLGPGGIGFFRDLNRMFGAAFDDPESYGANPPDDAYAAALLAKEHVFALAAVADGKIIGGLVAYALDKFEQARQEIYIYDLAVDERHRRQGVATALIATLRGLARASGAWVIFVQADHGDDPAIALYEKLGAREEVLHFDIAVE